SVDFLPTLLDLVGVRVPRNVQGVSFRDLIEGKTERAPRRYVFAQRISHALRDNTGRSVRTERYKLVRYFEPGRTVIYPTEAVPMRVSRHVERPRRNGTRPFVQLYDLKTDPNEFDDVAGSPKYAKVVKDLSRRLHAWMREVNDPILKGPLVTPYYRKSMEDFRQYRGD
ncbi:MAG: sulfatase, partial [Phycisphaerae bacterium]|nr:sulfatase [Phycisphaerae bacterium]